MNILHISRTMGQGGAEKVVYQICKDKTEDTNMFIASTGGILEDKLKESNVKHITIPDINDKNPMKIIKTIMILNKTIKKYNIDCIHSHHRMAAFYARILTIFRNDISCVYTAHNVFYDKIKLLRFALRKTKIIAVGDGVKNNLINVYGINENNIQIIYNSVEMPNKLIEVKDNLFNKDNKILIGTIGRLSEQKGIDIFIKAIANVIKENKEVYGIVIGDGELREELEKLTETLNISENIYFLGYRSDVLEIISKLDFVVLSSRWEGFPLTPIETFMMGKSIIATNIDGNNEIVVNEKNGLLFEKDDYEELSNCIFRLLQEKKLLKKLEENAKNDYIEKYSYDTFKKKYIEVYKK